MKASLAKIVKQQTSALEKRAMVMVYVTESSNLPIKTSLANVTLDGQAQSVSRSITVTISLVPAMENAIQEMMTLSAYAILDSLGNFVVRLIFVKHLLVLHLLFAKKVTMGICVSVHLDWEETTVTELTIV